MEMTVQEQQLASGSIRKTVWKYGIPCALITLVNALYNIVDQIFIGQGVGYLGNSATNVIFPLTTIALALGLLVGSGCAANYSIFLGSGKREKASACMANSIVFIFIESILFMVVCLLLLPKMVIWFGATEASYQYAIDYGSIIIYGFCFYMVSIGFSNMLRADGRPKVATVSTVIGCIINCILDPLFIFVCHWGVKGAAWATIIGQFASLVFSTVFIFRPQMVKFKAEDFKLSLRLFGKIASAGITEFTLNVCIAVLFIVNNNLMRYYGALSKFGADIPLATYGIMMKLSHILTAIATGMGQGAQPLIGFCFGNGDYTRVKKTIRFSLLQGLIIGVAVWLLCMIFARPILLLFGAESELYMNFGVKLIRTYLGLVFLNSLVTTSSNIFMSLGKGYLGAILQVSRNLILCAGVGAILCSFIGVEGVVYEGLIADGGAFVLAAVLMLITWKQLGKIPRSQGTQSQAS